MAYNLPSFREREYVRIENVFILELVVWPSGSIVQRHVCSNPNFFLDKKITKTTCASKKLLVCEKSVSDSQQDQIMNKFQAKSPFGARYSKMKKILVL